MPESPSKPGGPSAQTLRLGDSGPAVADLQQRLKQAGYLGERAAEDGVFSGGVRDAVYRYQVDQQIQGDKQGEYGPHTRRFLEAHTSG